MSRKLPERWLTQPQPDGTVRLVRRRGAGELMFLLLWNAIWNGLTGVFTAIGLGWKFPGEYSGPVPGSPTFWLFLSPFLLIGACSLWALVHGLGRTEWVIRSNELVTSWSLLGLRSARRYMSASLFVERIGSETEGQPVLKIEVEGKKQTLCYESDAERLAEVIAARTGWTLHRVAPSPFRTAAGERVPASALPERFSAGSLTLATAPGRLTVVDQPTRVHVIGGLIAGGIGLAVLGAIFGSSVLRLVNGAGPIQLGSLAWAAIGITLTGLLLRPVAGVVLRFRRGGDTYAFDRPAGELTRNGKRLAGLSEITGIRMESRSGNSESSPDYRVWVTTASGRKIALGEWQSEQAPTQAVTDRVAEFLGVDAGAAQSRSSSSISLSN